MKKLFLLIAILAISSSSAFAQFMNTQPQTAAPNTSTTVKSNAAGEKSPALAGLLSFVIPGAGQFYNGESSKAWVDLGVQVGCGVVAIVGSRVAANAVIKNSTAGYYVGLALTGLAGVGALVNEITSIIDAVNSAKKINIANGYAYFETEKGTLLGVSPALVSTSLALNGNPDLNIAPGMKFSVRF